MPNGHTWLPAILDSLGLKQVECWKGFVERVDFLVVFAYGSVLDWMVYMLPIQRGVYNVYTHCIQCVQFWAFLHSWRMLVRVIVNLASPAHINLAVISLDGISYPGILTWMSNILLGITFCYLCHSVIWLMWQNIIIGVDLYQTKNMSFLCSKQQEGLGARYFTNGRWVIYLLTLHITKAGFICSV